MNLNGHPIYWILKRALYGERKAPQLFNKFLHSALTELGMRNLKTEPTYYVKDGI